MRLFNRNRQAPRADTDAAGDRHASVVHPPYDPDLIEGLQAQHRAILALLGEMQRQSETCDFVNLLENLGRLKRALQAHVLEENLRLYAYLARSNEPSPEDFPLIREMRVEMGDILRRMNELVGDYTQRGVDYDNADDFERDLSALAGILDRRFRKEEESLYTLYMLPGYLEARFR